MHNPEKMAALGTQDEEKQNKNTTQYVLDPTERTETQIMQTRHESSHRQSETKKNRTS